MKIKTSDTFFPTKFRPITANTNQQRRLQSNQNSRSYKLVKKRSSTQQSYSKESNQYQSANIFNNIQPDCYQFNYQKDRPIGGVDLFLKQQNKKNKGSSIRKLSNHTQLTQNKRKQAQGQVKQSAFATKRQESSTELKQLNQQNPRRKQQVFRSHNSYDSHKTRKTVGSQNQYKIAWHEALTNQKTKNHNNWIDKQTQNFQSKMSILNQVYYKKPIVEKYGDRYFQYFLRNRYQDDFASPVYIHQIRSQLQAKNVNNDKFISKIKKMHPNIRNFQKLVVKGRHFTNLNQAQIE